VLDADGANAGAWREDLVRRLVEEHRVRPLFIAGSATNPGNLYGSLDHIVLLSAPGTGLLERVARRTNNAYGKSSNEQALIPGNLRDVRPPLQKTCPVEIDPPPPRSRCPRAGRDC
jgi:hypothetical protein